MAFFPCIYFETMSMLAFSWDNLNYRKLDSMEKTDKILERAGNRYYFYTLLLKFVYVVMAYNIRLIIENPATKPNYLLSINFVKQPDIIDTNRMIRGDYFVKPTAYWFFNCEPTYGLSIQNNKPKRIIDKTKGSKQAGLCSEERSMISPDYARNFIHDFILGKEQKYSQLNLF